MQESYLLWGIPNRPPIPQEVVVTQRKLCAEGPKHGRERDARAQVVRVTLLLKQPRKLAHHVKVEARVVHLLEIERREPPLVLVLLCAELYKYI